MTAKHDRCGNGDGAFRVAVAAASFDFRDVELDDPKPTGQQLLRAAGCRPPDEHLIFQVLDDGALDERRLEETVELRESDAERFITFRSDRSFRVEIDDRRFEWGDEELTGLIAKQLVGADLECTGVWLERRREADRFIQDSDIVRLGADGVERLRTSPVYLLDIEEQGVSLARADDRHGANRRAGWLGSGRRRTADRPGNASGANSRPR